VHWLFRIPILLAGIVIGLALYVSVDVLGLAVVTWTYIWGVIVFFLFVKVIFDWPSRDLPPFG